MHVHTCVHEFLCVSMAVTEVEWRGIMHMTKGSHYLTMEPCVATKTQTGFLNSLSQHLSQRQALSRLLPSALLLNSHCCWRKPHGESRDKTILSKLNCELCCQLSILVPYNLCCFGMTPPGKSAIVVQSQ